jgi:hypothetical protein
MKILTITFIVFLFFVQPCRAQGAYVIKGVATDTLISSPMYLSSVVLLRATDTVIESFTRADDNGGFSLSVKKAGKYILQIAHPGYADYTDVINVKDSLTNLGEIAMLSKEHLLKEFVFTQQVAAIKIKGDTTEYMADSFKVQGGASVEELLKKLPGISVDKNGQITAQGQTVQKVLVDGEEFFSDDPKVVTQGLQANTVEKVQVFDKKSDQAEFTGIDDGEKTKTINLQLKENMKKGFFGKAEAGGGSDKYYQEQLMVNAFKGKRQLAAFGIASNTDKVGLGWQENEKYGTGGGITEVGDDGSWTMYGAGYDEFSGWDGTYRGDGLPMVATGGAHFADKWNHDKQHVSGSYRAAQQQVRGTGSNSKLYTLNGDTSRVNTEDKQQKNSINRHKLNALYEWKIDSTSSLRMILDGGLKEARSTSFYNTETYNVIGDSVGGKTVNKRDINSVTNEQSFSADVLFRKKFAKKGRSFSLDFRQTYNDTHGSGSLVSGTSKPGTTVIDSIDQKKVNNSNAVSSVAKAIYTEPLSKTAFIEGNYSMTINNSTSLNESRDKGAGLDYDVLNQGFSSNYSYDILINQGGLALKFIYKKLNFSFGSDVSQVRFSQTDKLHGDTTLTRPYSNLFPKANFNYKFSRQTSFNFSYQGSTRQPNITQIQPLNQNTDPLNIVIGNPSLKQEFTNRFNMRFNNYKVLTQSYTYAGITFNTVSDAISTAQKISGPVNYTQYMNVNGNYSANWYSGYSFKLKKPAIQLEFSFNGNSSKVNNFVNEEKNVSLNNSYTFGTTISYEKEDKYEFSYNPSINYNDNKSTISINSVNYWVFENEVSADVQLPKNIRIGSSANMMFRQKTTVFTSNNSIIKWNANISKKFLKKKQLVAKLFVFDMLNQNLGYSRTAQGNVITQNSYNTIRRYGMLSLTWNFTYSPGAAAATAEDDDE